LNTEWLERTQTKPPTITLRSPFKKKKKKGEPGGHDEGVIVLKKMRRLKRDHWEGVNGKSLAES